MVRARRRAREQPRDPAALRCLPRDARRGARRGRAVGRRRAGARRGPRPRTRATTRRSAARRPRRSRCFASARAGWATPVQLLAGREEHPVGAPRRSRSCASPRVSRSSQRACSSGPARTRRATSSSRRGCSSRSSIAYLGCGDVDAARSVRRAVSPRAPSSRVARSSRDAPALAAGAGRACARRRR